MNLSRIAVLFLRLASLGGVLFTLIMAACPLLMPEEIPGVVAETFSPGCFVAVFLVALIPLSLVPAAVAWIIQAKNVKPQDEAEKRWRDAALSREERLGAWIRYLTNCLLCNVESKSLPLLLQAEIPRAARELDRGRRARLLRFLREIGLEDCSEGGDVIADDIPDAEPKTILPRHGLVSLAAGAFALLSGLCLLWAGLTVATIIFANTLEAVGMSYGKLIEISVALSLILTLALVSGLASSGIRRLYRKAVRSLDRREGDRGGIQELILRSVQDQMEALARWVDTGDEEGESVARRIAGATLAITAPELDGSHRAVLVRLLYERGWLNGERKLSLKGFDLRAAEFGGVRLPRVCLSGADLSGADFNSADLKGADLSGCTLCGSDLRSACLVSANLRGADLRYSRFQQAVLDDSDLREALLDGANFWGAALSGAELSGAQGNAEYLPSVAEAV